MALDFPTIFLLDAHLTPEKRNEIEQKIPTLTRDIKEAKLVIGRVTMKQRAQLALRCCNIWTEDVAKELAVDEEAIPISTPPRKRRRVDDSSTESDTQSDETESSGNRAQDNTLPARNVALKEDSAQDEKIFRVVKLAWFEDSLKAGELLPINEKYLVYEGRQIPKPDLSLNSSSTAKRPREEDILTRAKAEAYQPTSSGSKNYRTNTTHQSKTRPTHLLRQTTSEHDDPSKYPPVPAYLQQPFSCCRPTPAATQNYKFIALLKKIQHIRKLQGDEHFGVRAYGAAISSIAAYPHTLRSPHELMRLPHCNSKIGLLFQEFMKTGTLQEADSLETDEQLRILGTFYEIFGCADTTAMKFWNMGFRTLDDITENYWESLTRVQKVGLKFYDDFQIRIPRSEVERIGQIVLKTANDLWEDGGFQMLIVGGYRRGKEYSGDVDVVLSNPDEAATKDFIHPLVDELIDEGYVTHNLSSSTANSERGQQPLALKVKSERGNSSGFDTLDKANVVWQDIDWPTKEADTLAATQSGSAPKNPNLHRRVDIIISPWKTVGCAVAGWSSGTTFQRDMRKYCKEKKDVRFDSSGVRDLKTGKWVDLEGPSFEGVERGEKEGMVEAEKRVFEGLGLVWWRPEERCTA